jgi:hypothetical protein
MMKTTPTNQYMFLVRGGACQDGEMSPEQMQAKMTEVYAWIEGLTKRGIMSAAQPLTPDRKLVSGLNAIVSDGIAAESKEAIGGFFIVNVATMDEAVNIARTCPMFKHGGGQLEVRRIAELTCE